MRSVHIRRGLPIMNWNSFSFPFLLKIPFILFPPVGRRLLFIFHAGYIQKSRGISRRNAAPLPSHPPDDGRLHVHRVQRRPTRRQQTSSSQRQL